MEVLQFCSNSSEYDPPNLVQNDNILLKLRPYQLKAINWMKCRENRTFSTQLGDNIGLHPLWVPLVSRFIFNYSFKIPRNNKPFSYNPYNNHITLQKMEEFDHVRGGILADDMGLGKTIEVIGLVLENPAKFEPEKIAEPEKQYFFLFF
jgi:SNF2 family DNA or RNA helicase